jgi:hypothetical protein
VFTSLTQQEDPSGVVNGILEAMRA